MTSGAQHLPPENPFSTRAVRPGAIPFLFPAEESAITLVERLRQANWRGEIRGPHGAGKSTLLATLLPLLAAQGKQVVLGQMEPEHHRLPAEISQARPWGPETLLVIDGYEQLSRCRRALLVRASQRAGCGLLVTTHEATGLPLLIQLEPEQQIVRQVVAQLLAETPGAITEEELQQAWQRHGANVRELLFELYDRYEERRRGK